MGKGLVEQNKMSITIIFIYLLTIVYDCFRLIIIVMFQRKEGRPLIIASVLIFSQAT